MPENSPKKPKLKPLPPPPHIEIVDQDGTALPVNKVEIQEDAEGIFYIKVEIQLPSLRVLSNSFKPTPHRSDRIYRRRVTH